MQGSKITVSKYCGPYKGCTAQQHPFAFHQPQEAQVLSKSKAEGYNQHLKVILPSCSSVGTHLGILA